MRMCASSYVTSNTIKLREHPKASPTKRYSKEQRGQGNDLGYGKNGDDATMGNLQPSPKGLRPMDAVHRLNVGGWK